MSLPVNELISKIRVRNVKSILSNVFVSNAGIGSVVYCGTVPLAANLFPVTGGTGTAGAILKGNWFRVTVSSTVLLGDDGGIIPKGAMIMAAIDTPGQTSSNWIQMPSIA